MIPEGVTGAMADGNREACKYLHLTENFRFGGSLCAGSWSESSQGYFCLFNIHLLLIDS